MTGHFLNMCTVPTYYYGHFYIMNKLRIYKVCMRMHYLRKVGGANFLGFQSFQEYSSNSKCQKITSTHEKSRWDYYIYKTNREIRTYPLHMEMQTI